MDLASVVAALASVGVRVSGSTPNNNIQGDSSRACPTGLAGPEPSGTHNDPGQHFQEPRLPAREDGRPGEGQRLTPDATHNGGRPITPGDGPPPPPRHAAPKGHARQGNSVRPPHPHARAHSMWVADRNSPTSGRAVRGGGAPDHRRPSKQWKAPPRERPSATPTASKVARCGASAGSHARTERTRDIRVAEPRLPAPEDGRPGEGQRLTPDAPHNGGRPPPPGTAPHHPHGTQPPQSMQAKGTVLGPHTHTSTPTARGWRTPTAQCAGSRGRGRA